MHNAHAHAQCLASGMQAWQCKLGVLTYPTSEGMRKPACTSPRTHARCCMTMKRLVQAHQSLRAERMYADGVAVRTCIYCWQGLLLARTVSEYDTRGKVHAVFHACFTVLIAMTMPHYTEPGTDGRFLTGDVGQTGVFLPSCDPG